MTLFDTIFCRKSCRSYDMTTLPPETLDEIAAFFAVLQPLLPGMRAKLIFTTPDHIECIQPWKAPHYAVLYADDHALNYENIGYMGQMLDLYLQSRGLGCCWLGLGRLDDKPGTLPREVDGLQFAIMMAFGRAKDSPHRKLPEFKRKPLEEMADSVDKRLEVVRLAPSAVNSQPWYFTHANNLLHLYRIRFDMIRQRMYGKYNRFDTGIALAHMAVAYPDTFTVISDAPHPESKGHDYVISCRI